MLGRILKNINFFKSARKTKDIYYFRSFMLDRKIKIFFLQICQAVSKINQGSCLGCLGGDDAPELMK